MAVDLTRSVEKLHPSAVNVSHPFPAQPDPVSHTHPDRPNPTQFKVKRMIDSTNSRRTEGKGLSLAWHTSTTKRAYIQKSFSITLPHHTTLITCDNSRRTHLNGPSNYSNPCRSRKEKARCTNLTVDSSFNKSSQPELRFMPSMPSCLPNLSCLCCPALSTHFLRRSSVGSHHSPAV